jgi:hypothetical protein
MPRLRGLDNMTGARSYPVPPLPLFCGIFYRNRSWLVGLLHQADCQYLISHSAFLEGLRNCWH